jgi:hypothetical protein
LLGSEGARTGRGALSAAIAGVGAAAARRRGWNPTRTGDGVRGGVHARQASTAGAQGWDWDGVSPWCMAEPGSAPWAAASTASTGGLRACVRAWFGQVRASVAAKERRKRTGSKARPCPRMGVSVC